MIFGLGEWWRVMYLQLAELGSKSREYWEAWASKGALAFALLFWASPNKPFHIARWFARKHDGYAQRANAQKAWAHTLAQCTIGVHQSQLACRKI